MSTPDRSSLLGVELNTLDMAQVVDRVLVAARERRPLGVSALAVHGVMEAVRDRELQYRLNDLELVVPDGQPVRWGLNWLHAAELHQRVYGPALMAVLCERAADEELPIYLFGSTEETLERLRANLKRRHPTLQVAGSQPSRFRPAAEDERRRDLETIHSSGARMVFVGLGCPRQEVWVYENRRDLSLPALAVGAAFDYHAGTLARPPEWMQDRGLEWLHRLVQEPRRLWRRYLLLNPAYLTLLTLQKMHLKTIDTRRASEPAAAVRPS